MIEKEVDIVILGGGIVGSWVAKRALVKGLKVAVIEVGPKNPSDRSEPKPKLYFPERIHIGATEARNHCLTGNSKFWGGGLITNDIISLKNLLNSQSHDFNLEKKMMDEYANVVVKEFEIPLPQRSLMTIRNDIALIISEILVLSGKKRNIWNKFYNNNIRNNSLTLLLGTTDINIEYNKVGKRIEFLNATNNEGQFKIRASNYVLSMGAIDSNIFVLEKLALIVENFELAGKRLHDHWSVPIGKIKWMNNSLFNNFFPPYFINNQIIGKRIEIRPEKNAPVSGFMHIQASYDTTPPYSILKNILFHTQKDLSVIESSKNALALMKYFPTLVKLGWERFINQKLFIPNGTELNIVLDFESYPDPLNKISRVNDNYNLNWNLRSNDFKHFKELYVEAEKVISALINSDEEKRNVSLLSDWTKDFDSYLIKNAIDAYHLGGGLNLGSDPSSSIVDRNMRFHSIKNLTALGTSTFNNPGIANPVLTLLSQAENFINSL